MRKHKVHAPHAVQDIAANKKKFLTYLEAGYTSGAAAKKVGVVRSTAYNWRAQDEKFSDDWDDAVETGLDLLEHSVYQRGLTEGGEDARFILRGRRRDVFGHAGDAAPRQTSKMILTITLQEHIKQMERLGLPIPVIETDYEEEDAK
jgi:hypothetical protein